VAPTPVSQPVLPSPKDQSVEAEPPPSAPVEKMQSPAARFELCFDPPMWLKKLLWDDQE
jgi:hypothetical protein